MLQNKMPFVTPNSHVATFSISGLSSNFNQILFLNTSRVECSLDSYITDFRFSMMGWFATASPNMLHIWLSHLCLFLLMLFLYVYFKCLWVVVCFGFFFIAIFPIIGTLFLIVHLKSTFFKEVLFRFLQLVGIIEPLFPCTISDSTWRQRKVSCTKANCPTGCYVSYLRGPVVIHMSRSLGYGHFRVLSSTALCQPVRWISKEV